MGQHAAGTLLPDGPVVIAPDKFTGSLTAPQAADAMGAGVRDACPDAEVVQRPVADGGDGTVDVLVAAGWSPRAAEVPGPTGAAVRTRIAWRGATAAVELADCCGRSRLPGGRPAPTTATTRGLGVAIRRAVQDGAGTVLVGVGGSASTDGGLGLLAALGVRVLQADGRAITVPGALVHADRIDHRQMAAGLSGVRLVLATDVQAPLLGESGAARLFGPQKGATSEEVEALESAMTRWAEVLNEHRDQDIGSVPGAGAGGGVVAGILGGLAPRCTVEVVSGADVVLDAIELDTAIESASVVLIGEGCLDAQSLLGKAPVVVARRAGIHERPVLAVAGRVELGTAARRAVGITNAVSLAEIAEPGEDPMRDAAVLARRAAAVVVTRSVGL